MDIKQLKFLIALDETRHFGQAAARCHITQPTLSMRLRSLEEELDLPLVNRGQRFEGFTAPGERVLAWARTVLAAYDHVLKASHLFNLMDARGAIAVAERQSYIGRIRDLTKSYERGKQKAAGDQEFAIEDADGDRRGRAHGG